MGQGASTSQAPIGVYNLDSGGRLYVAPMIDESGSTLQFAFSSSRLEGRAKRQPNGSYADDDSCQTQLAFSAERVLIQTCKAKAVGVREFIIVRTPFRITASDGVSISGCLWTRQGFKAKVGVVLAHGADDESQDMGTIIPMFLSRGLSVASFDQRGVGRSGGAWRSDGILQVAADVAQIARLLQTDYGLRRVGFYGFSNGGWVAPAAAARFADPAFVIIKSGDSESVADNVQFEQVTTIGKRFGPDAGRAAGALLGQVFKALESDSNDDWHQAKVALKAAEAEPWIRSMPLPPSEALPLPPAVKAGFSRQLIYDPASDIQRLQCPILVLLGTDDLDVNTQLSGERYKSLAKAVGNRALTVHFLVGAGHQLAMGPGGAANSSLVTGVYANGFPELMFDWIEDRVKPAPDK